MLIALAVSVILVALSLAMRQPFPRDRRVILSAVVVGIFNTGSSGLVLGLAGIAVLVGAPDTGGRPEAVTASVLLALMAVTWAIGTILQARELRRGSPLPLVAIGSTAGSLFLLPLAAVQAGEGAVRRR